MFRTISLVQAKEEADVAAIVSAARRMIEDESEIVWGQVMGGLRRMKQTHSEASYSMILDFEDEDSWRRYGAGPHHAAFAAIVAPIIERVTLTEYVFVPGDGEA